MRELPRRRVLGLDLSDELRPVLRLDGLLLDRQRDGLHALRAGHLLADDGRGRRLHQQRARDLLPTLRPIQGVPMTLEDLPEHAARVEKGTLEFLKGIREVMK